MHYLAIRTSEQRGYPDIPFGVARNFDKVPVLVNAGTPAPIEELCVATPWAAPECCYKDDDGRQIVKSQKRKIQSKE